MYVDIDWEEFREFMYSWDYYEGALEGWIEIPFFKDRNDRNLFCCIGSTFTESGQRGCGKDAIRCMLCRNDTARPVWMLKSVKREQGWRCHLGERLGLLDRLLETAGLCPNCRGFMIPKPNRDHRGMFWSCINFPQCRGTRWISYDLVNKIIPVTRFPK